MKDTADTAGCAFVAGASGYTGRKVVPALRDAGLRVVAHVRPDSSRLDHWREHFGSLGAELDSSAWQQTAITAALQHYQPTLVFALLGTTRSRAKREGGGASYETVDYGLTVMLLRAAEQLESPPRFVYLSSAGVRESRPGSYLQARWRVEQALLASAVPHTIARPSIISGDDRDDNRTGERVAAVVADGALALLGAIGGRGLRDRYRSTDNDTLARALVRHALDPAMANKIVESEALRD